jgi:5-methyltetrahydrofolate--homocysteine methyltransferase
VYPNLSVDPGNFWWQATQRLLAEACQSSHGRYVISIPDLQGGGEILALLRGSEALAYDLVDQPEVIAPAIAAINRAWLEYYQACYEIIHRWQPGYVDWLGIWSDLPAVTVECDYAVMVSPRMFARHFLPGVEQQVGMVARSVFHLDGPGAIPHLEHLLALPGLRAIQWVPTPDRPSPLQWIPLLRRIQAGGKGVVAACSPQEVLPLLQALNPQQVILTTTCATPVEADALMSAIYQQIKQEYR